jgi:coatomer subunit beta'
MAKLDTYSNQLILSSVKTSKWIGDCFIYTNSVNRLNYLLGTQTNTVANFDT